MSKFYDYHMMKIGWINDHVLTLVSNNLNATTGRISQISL